ncbi:MAG: 50S ribosomal protein L35 [Candidatus Colwellbacteria bacterium]|nr:50S ribosomal protein L35 [Candidatus Colwellbacteria bacterium]
MDKTSKTFSKRIKITKTGKLIRRHMGLSHFKAKKSPKSIRSRRNDITIASVDLKALKAHL